MSRPPDVTAAADRKAFHRHIATINRRRVVPLTLATAALLSISIVFGVVQTGWPRGSLLSGGGINFTGLFACGVVLAIHRWGNRPGLSAIAYGYLVLAWGDLTIPTYLHEVEIAHSQHAAQQLVVYFITRYLAAVSIVWRPRDLAIALILNHLVSLWPLLPTQGVLSTYLFPGVWTATAWLGAFMIYRAQRDAFDARLRLEEQRDQLVTANTHLEQLNQEKNDLMAIAAHDLRSPLMGMTTLLNIAAQDAARTWASGVATLRAIEQSGRDMADLVTRVLDAHQAEETLQRVSVARGDIVPVVTRVVDALRPVATAKDITLSIEIPPGACEALHDAHALSRILDNLGSNAIKFSPRGGRVEVRVTAGAAGDGPTIEVTDSGPGIAEDERPRLFRKFARLRAKPTAGESSSGLGLYIAKRLVDAMNGTILVSGAPGGGAMFTVTLSAGGPARSIG